jgi:hypothetical protein
MNVKRLREVLNYDSETGVFRWKERLARKLQIGDVAGHVSAPRGTVQIRINGVNYLAHRLAWMYMHGQSPKATIDHLNGNPSDNRIANLRDVSHQMNMENIRHASAHSRSGVLGAHEKNGRWRSRIHVDGKSHWLGYFDSADRAHKAYLKAKRQLHKGCTI